MNKNVFLNLLKGFNEQTIFVITTFLFFRIFSGYLFKAALYKLTFELHRDAQDFSQRQLLILIQSVG
jgi:hypothetical protein